MKSEKIVDKVDVELLILDVLRGGGRWTSAEIIKGVRRRVTATPDVDADTRFSLECQADHIMGRVTPAKNTLLADGQISRCGIGVFHITDDGEDRLAREYQAVATTQGNVIPLFIRAA